ncbi:hypothetical protein VHEMI03118 [[Torrubiella] hemipterigena]|nr:hypothetical protein VHEMI03118 [[Torrubiella] hemipterigena]
MILKHRITAALGGVANRNHNNNSLVIGLAVAIPLAVVFILVWWFGCQRKKNMRKRQAFKAGTGKAENTGVGKQRRKKPGKMAAWFGWDKRVKPAPRRDDPNQFPSGDV